MRRRLLAEMTARACADHLRVINRVHVPVAARLVTDLAHVRTGDMRETLAARVTAVVAAHTVVANALMIEKRRTPERNAMAGHAVLCGGDMGRGLACGLDTVVTARAVIDNPRVIKREHGAPPNRTMAPAALLGRRNMTWRFARRGDTVVAAGTDRLRGAVVHACRHAEPGAHRMAYVAIGQRHNVR